MDIDAETLSNLIATYGLIGLFLAIFVSNLFPITGLSFTIATSFFILLSSGASQPTILAVAALPAIAAAATLAKLLIFGTARGVTQRFQLVKRKRREFAKAVKGREHIIMAITIFVAMTPLPDDAWYIPLGAVGFNAKLFAISVFTGKLLQAMVAMTLGTSIGSSLSISGAIDAISVWRILLSVILTMALALTITYVGLRIDWVRFTMVYAERGLWGAVRDALLRALEKR